MSHVLSASPAWRRVFFALSVVLLAAMTFGPAFARNGMALQSLSPQAIAVTKEELGPNWIKTGDSGNRSALWNTYSVEYENTKDFPELRITSFTVGVAGETRGLDPLINYLRESLEARGFAISSLVNEGFGDGKGFRGNRNIPGGGVAVVYMFRVKTVVGIADALGPASKEGEVQALALKHARMQEQRLWAAFAPPATPTPVPTAVPAPIVDVPAPIPTPTPAPVVVATAPFCQPGEEPAFRGRIAALKEQVGDAMGIPTSCEFADPAGSGDMQQITSTGLVAYRGTTDTVTFTAGVERWASTPEGLVYDNGAQVQPAPEAPPAEEMAPTEEVVVEPGAEEPVPVE